MEKIDNIKRPVNIGEKFLVPCIVKKIENYETLITPVWNHPHNDKENGQKEVHYHIDSRFFNEKSKFLSKNYLMEDNFRPLLDKNSTLEYFVLPVLKEIEDRVTHTAYIKKSNIKHKCIYKGKCPHRGMDLSQVKPKDGVIKCPLHGLTFHEKTGKLLTRRYDDNQKPRTKKYDNK